MEASTKLRAGSYIHLLIDADSLLYKAGFVVNSEGQEQLACWQLDQLCEVVLADVRPDTYQFYISGSNNFRYNIYPEYKGNRVDMARPIHLGALRQHIVTNWAATVTDGIEADDAVGIAQCTTEDTCISHIDKDIDCIPGMHHNYNKMESYIVSNEQAMFNFYMQLIQGDKGDNIPGFDGKMRPKLPQFLYPVRDQLNEAAGPEEMFDIVLGYYQEDVRKLDLSARLLWIQRKEYDDWTNYLNVNTMGELGRLDDLTALLQARSEPPLEDGLLNLSV